MKKRDTYCFVAGQSGGHIIPCITLAQKIIAQYPQSRIIFFTTHASLDAHLTQSLGTSFTIIALPISSIANHSPFKFMLFAIKFLAAFCISFYKLVRTQPQSITSTGGICTIPVALAAYLLRIPINLYELNVLPGKTTYFLASLTRIIYCCFTRTIDFLPTHKCQTADYPIRFSPRTPLARTDTCTILKFDPNKKTILIIGGSQGSLFINNIIKQWITNSAQKKDIQIIHQTGAHDTTNWYLLYKQQGIHAIVFQFSGNMEQYYTAADLVICRSGAGTLFEMLYFHKPCITIPLELHSNSHQIHNAFTVAQKHPEHVRALTQNTLNRQPELLTEAIYQMLAAQGAQVQNQVPSKAPREKHNQMTTT